MYRTQCVLALLALFVGLAHCFTWDVVLGGKKQLEFYDNNGKLTHAQGISSNTTQSIAYDPVYNRVLFVEPHDSYKSISSFDIATKKTESLFKSTVEGTIRIAYDPATQLLFWVNTYTIETITIRSTLIKPGSNYAVYRNLSVDFNDRRFFDVSPRYDESPRYIAVDSCGGYIYWTTVTKIERARFDGSEREIVISSREVWRNSITIDQQAHKMYWTDNHYYSGTSVESADLNGENRRTLYSDRTGNDAFDELTVSNDFVYCKTRTIFMQLSKNSIHDKDMESKTASMPPHYTSYYSQYINDGIAANYKINEQSCEKLKSLLPLNSVSSDYDSLNDSIVASVLCVNGTKVSGEARCECTQGYIGERCDVSVCHNYCFQGDCSVTSEGQPKCRCNAGYSGKRCEANACNDYCLNNGVCSLNETSDPVCQCTGGFEGTRCDVSICQNYCFQGECSTGAEGQPLCRCYTGYSGERCESNVCSEYCSNHGVCSLNKEGEPVCQCSEEYEGERCDVPVFRDKCIQTVLLLREILNTDFTPVTLGKRVNSTSASTAA